MPRLARHWDGCAKRTMRDTHFTMLVTYQRARAEGLLTYHGKPCHLGHMAKRYTSTRACCLCVQVQGQGRRRPRTTVPHVDTAAQRRSALFGLHGAATLEQEAALRYLQGGRCAYCGSQDMLERDHKAPITRDGTHAIGNLQWLCQHHNRSKGRHSDSDYRQRNGIAAVTPWESVQGSLSLALAAVVMI